MLTAKLSLLSLQLNGTTPALQRLSFEPIGKVVKD
jgi:hypothetical protein